jgi:hypothetical protein
MRGVKFLTKSMVQTEIRRIMKKQGEALIAVAFWGDGGATTAGVLGRTNGKTRVLCDLFSGSCNPDEIATLRKSKIEVRSLDGMHAKVWCVDEEIVIGSANASANGLGFEGKELLGNTEAAVLVNDSVFAKKVRAWFEKCWRDLQTRKIGSKEVDDVRALWELRRRQRHRQGTKTLLEALSAPGTKKLFERVRVVAYKPSDVSNEVERAYDEQVKATYSESHLSVYPDTLPFYEDDKNWDIHPGDVILDFHCARKRATPSLDGIWRVREKGWVVDVPTPNAPSNRMILCDPLIDVAGYRLPKAELKLLSDLIKTRLERGKWSVNNGSYLDEPLVDFWQKSQKA